MADNNDSAALAMALEQLARACNVTTQSLSTFNKGLKNLDARSLASFEQEVEDSSKKLGKLSDEADKNRAAMNRFGKILSTSASAIAAPFKGLGAAALYFGKNLFELSLNMEKSGIASSFRRIGESSNDAMEGIAGVAKSMNLSIGTLSKQIETHAADLSAVGFDTFGKSVGKVHKSLNNLDGLGKGYALTIMDATAMMADNIAAQNITALYDRRTNQQRAASAAALIEDQIKMSHVLKISRTEIAKMNKELMENQKMMFIRQRIEQTMQGDFGEEIQTSMNYLSKVLDPNSLNAVMEGMMMLQQGINPENASAIQDMLRESPDFARSITSITRALVSGEELSVERINELLSSGLGDSAFDMSAMIAAGGRGFTQTMMNMAQTASQLAVVLKNAADGTSAIADAEAETRRTFMEALEKARLEIEKGLIKVFGNEDFQKSLQRLVELFPTIVGGMVWLAETILNHVVPVFPILVDALLDNLIPALLGLVDDITGLLPWSDGTNLLDKYMNSDFMQQRTVDGKFTGDIEEAEEKKKEKPYRTDTAYHRDLVRGESGHDYFQAAIEILGSTFGSEESRQRFAIMSGNEDAIKAQMTNNQRTLSGYSAFMSNITGLDSAFNINTLAEGSTYTSAFQEIRDTRAKLQEKLALLEGTNTDEAVKQRKLLERSQETLEKMTAILEEQASLQVRANEIQQHEQRLKKATLTNN
jgi:hypothetical protein